MLYEAELLVSSRGLLQLEPPEPGSVERLKTYFGFATKLTKRRQHRLAVLLGRTLTALKSCGLDDAVFAACDGELSFADRVGVPGDLDDLSAEVQDGPADVGVLRLFVTEPVDPKRALRLGVDVELHRVVPTDGYPLRLRVHGLLNALESAKEERWVDLRRRVLRHIRAELPARAVDGHADIPAEFHARVDALFAALRSSFRTQQIDRAQRAALVIPRGVEMAALEQPPGGAGFFTDLPGLGSSLRYTFAWPEAHHGVSYARTLILDGRGQPVLGIGPSPVIAGTPCGLLEPGIAPVHPPTPDIVAFSGHEWDAEARAEFLLAADERCEGVEGSIALRTLERRKHECGSNGPARMTEIGSSSPASITYESSDLSELYLY